MQQFQVPQFIEIEDKLFGPFSIRQFVFIAGGAGLCYLFFELTPRSVAVVLSIPTAALAVSMALVKINGQSFIKIAQAFLTHLFSDKLYLWKKDYSKTDASLAAKEIKKEPEPKQTTPALLSNSRLQDLSWSLDVLDNKTDNE